MKKTLLTVIISILVLSTLGSAINPLIAQNDTPEENENTISNDDNLDQYQTLQNDDGKVGWSNSNPEINYMRWQSFTPTFPVVTRIEVLIRKWGEYETTYPFFATIRDNLTGEDLTITSVEAEDVGLNLSWIEFDFRDIPVTVGETYYMHFYTSNEPPNLYFVGHYFNQTYDAYPNGTSYLRLIDNIYDLPYDITFKTYGRFNNPPETPEQPDGPTEGIVNIEYTYTTSATDPDGDPIEYGWDWDGDDTVDEWTTEETASHDWNEAGSYEIQVKARDEVGDESNFSQPLTVEIIGETELAIEFVKSGFGLSVVVKNIGDYEAVDVVWSADITGGILGLINESLAGDSEILPVDDEIVISLPTLIGLGPLKVVATASAANADEVTETWDGFILFIFIL